MGCVSRGAAAAQRLPRLSHAAPAPCSSLPAPPLPLPPPPPSARAADTYMAAAHSGRRPASEVRSLVAATAFDDFFRAALAGGSSGASGL